jgi:glycosyltransferase involved in cell wall biosynthesis
MKVCFIVGTLARGGAERQLLYMLQALKEGGVEARVLSLTNGEPYEAQIKDLGIPVEWVGRSSSRFARLSNIVASLKSDRPDIIQSSHFYTNFYAAAAGKLLGIPSVGAIRSNVTNEMRSNGAFGHLHLRLPKTLIANSRSAVAAAITGHSVHPARINFINNVVGHVREARKPDCSVCKILFAGRLVAVKRPELFVELASRLLAELPDRGLRFVIAGDGPLSEMICSKLQEHSLTEHFSMLGEVSDMSPVYAAADLLVMTSSHEGTPNVILEAMANGIPVVATKVGGIPELLGDDRGLLVDVEDLDDITRAAKRIVEDEQLRFSLIRNGRRYVAENHSMSQLRGRLMEIYRQLIGASKN